MQNLVRSILFTVVLSGLLLSGSAQRRGQNSRYRAEQEILDSIIKPEVRTNPGGNEPNGTKVGVEMYVRSIDALDEQNQELNLQVTLRMRWSDSRLSYSQSNSEGLNFVSLRGAEVNKVWTPDLFVGNEKNAQVHEFSAPNRFVRVYPNGDLVYSQRVSLSTICGLNYRNFPFDRQQCVLRFASYSNTNQDISFEWIKTNPIQVNPSLTLPQFSYESYETNTCHAETNTGVYSCINVTFNLRRGSRYYLVHIFIPLVMLAITSWLSFWIAPKDLVAKLLVTLISLGLMVVQVFNFNATTPRVNYTRAIDTYTGITLTFGFWALIQAIIVNYWARNETSDNCGAEAGDATAKAEETPEPEAEPLKPSGDEESGKPEAKKRQRPHPEKYFQSRYSALKSTSQKIDWVVRILYPVLFVLFLIVFFSVAATRN